MAQHVLIWEDGEKDSINTYIKSPAVVIHFHRDDFLTVTQLEEAKIPGIYILYADNKIYIGQAANNVISRIRQHDKNKSWWNNVVIFGREDSQLDKSQLDYMERTLIERFVSAGYDVDNNNEGNKSVIFTYQKGISQALLSSVDDILQDFLGMTIKPQKKLRPSVNNVIRKHSIGTTIEDNTGLKIHEKSVKQAYNSYVSEVLKNDDYYYKILPEIQSDSTWIITKEALELVYEDKKKRYYQVAENVYLYNNYSLKSLEKWIYRFSDLIERDVVINYDS